MSTKLPVPSAHALPGRHGAAGRRRPWPAAGLRPVSLAVALVGMAPLAFGLPDGASTVLGQAVVKQTSPARLDIQQGTARAAIDWTRFSIGAHEQVVVSQPGRGAVLVNRVLGNDPSMVFGSLRANGTVWLVNPRGIVFGRDSQVDVGGLLASTLGIRHADLASGRLLLSRGEGGAAALRAEGRISAPDGSVVLVAPSLLQSGRIDARRIGLAAATEVQVDVEGDGLVFFNARNDGSLDARLQQLGTLRADGGLVALHAAARAGMADTVLNLDGVVQARSIGRRGGRVVIDGGDSGLTQVAGVVDATGAAAGERGGVVVVAGQALRLAAGSQIDVSGQAGGGQVQLAAQVGALPADAPTGAAGDLVLAGRVLALGLGAGALGGQLQAVGTRIGQFGGSFIDLSGQAGGGAAWLGGGWQGSGPLPHASVNLMADAAQLRADALVAGAGGQLVLWSDGLTRFDGAISARGGAGGGAGGQVETSGKQQLSVHTGRVDLSAPAGPIGTWLLDPLAIRVQAGGPAVYADVSSFAAATAAEPATIDPAALNSRASVTLQATDAITINAPIAMTVAAAPLSLQTGGGGSITINSALSTTNGAISIASGSGGITSNAAGSIGAGSATISLDGGGGHVRLGAALSSSNASAAAIGINNAADLQLGAVAAGAAGTITLNFSGAGTQSGGAITAGALAKAGTGTLTLTAANSYAGRTTLTGGTLAVSADGQLGTAPGAATPGHLTLNGGTLLATETFTLAANRGVALQGTARVEVAADKTLTVAGSVADPVAQGSLLKLGAGTLVMGVANSYDGSTTVRAGKLSISADNQLGTAPALAAPEHLTFDGGTLLVTETFTLAANRGVALQGTGTLDVADTKTLTLAAAVSDPVATGSLVKTGTGTLVLGVANSHGGSTTVSAGTLSISADNRLGTAPAQATAGQLTLGGGTLLATETLSLDATRGVALQGTGSFEVAATKQLTVAGRVADGAAAGSLVKRGTGQLDLTGSNAYTGTTAVDAGQLKLLGGNAIADTAGLLTVAAAGSLVVGAAETLSRIAGAGALTLDATLTTGNNLDSSFSGAIGGPAGLVKQGSGVFTLSNPAANTYAGSTTLRAGKLGINADAQLGTAPGVATPGQLTLEGGTLLATDTFTLAANRGLALQGTGTLEVADTKTLSLAAAVADPVATGRLVKTGAGTLVLGVANSHDGGTTVSAGTLSIGADNRLGTVPAADTPGHLTLNGGTLLASESFSLAANRGVALQGTGALEVAATKTLVVAGTLADGAAAGSLAKRGAGGLDLGATNTYTGTTTVELGQLRLLGGDAVANAAGLVTVNAGATLVVGAAETLSRVAGAGVLTLNATLTAGNNLDSDFSGAIGGAGGLVKQGSGVLTLSNPAANTYAGSTTVTAGKLGIGADNQLGAVPVAATPGHLTLGGGTLLVADTFTLAANRGLALQGTGTLEVADTKTLTLATSIADPLATGNLVKAGAGTLTLSAVNTYDGSTTVAGGQLRLLGGDAIANSAGLVTVNAGASLVLAAAETLSRIAGAGVLTLDATLTTGNSLDSDFSGAIGGAGSLVKQGSGVLTLSNPAANTYAGSTTVAGGKLGLGADHHLGTLPGVATPGHLTLNGGTLLATESFALGANRGLALQGTATIEVATGKTLTLPGSVSDPVATGSLVKSGAGTLVLGAANSHGGNTTVTGGRLGISADDQLGPAPLAATPGQLVLNGGALLVTETLTLAANRGVALQGTGTIEVAAGKTLTLPGGLADPVATGSLVKSGAGTLALSVASSHDGSTTVAAGTLRISAEDQLGTAPLVATPGLLALSGGTLLVTESLTLSANRGLALQGTGTIEVADGKAVTVAGSLADPVATGSLVKAGAGTLRLSAANTHDGSTTVTGGTLILSADNQLGTAPALATPGHLAFQGGSLQATETLTLAAGRGLVLQGATTLEVAAGKVLTVAGNVADGAAAGGITKTGTGVLVLGGNNSHSDGSTLRAGTLVQGSANALGSAGRISFEGGTLQYSAAGTSDQSARFSSLAGQQFRLDTNGQTVTLAADLSSDGASLVKLGTGSLVLAGSNRFGNGISLQGGSLSLGSADAIGSSGLISFDGGALQSGAANATDYSARFSTAANQAVHLDTNGRDLDLATNLASVGGTLTKSGAGVLTVLGANSYTGGTHLDGGSLALGSAGALASSGSIHFGGGALRFTAANSGDLSARFSNAAAQALRLDTNGLQVVLAGNLASVGGSLSKLGAGTLTLSAASSYSGGTTVEAGTLALSGASAVAGTAGIVVGGAGGAATLDLRNGAVVAQTITLGEGATLANAAGSGTLAATGNLVLAGNTNLAVSGAGSGLSVLGRISESLAGSHLATSGNSVTLANHNSHTGGTTVLAGTLAISAASVADADAGSGTVVVGANALLLLNHGAVLHSAVALSGGTVGNTAGSGTLAGAVTLSGSNLLQSSGTGLLVAGQVGGSGGLAAAGGSVTLSGAGNHYSGATAVTAGTLSALGGSALSDLSAVSLSGTATLALGSSEVIGSLAGSAGTTVSLGSHSLSLGGDNLASTRYAGTLTGAAGAGLVKTGSGSFTLEGASSHTGTTTVDNGTLALAGAGRLADGSSLVVRGGVVDLGGLADSVAGVRITGGSIRNGTLSSASAVDLQAGSISAVLAGGAGLHKTGDGTVTLTAANTGTGRSLVEGGTLLLSGGNQRLAAATTLEISGGVLDLGGGAQTVAALQQRGGEIRNGTLTSSSTVDLQAGRISAVLAGSQGLRKTGAGSATLAAANLDTGSTTVEAGTLALAGAGRLADTSRLVVSGGLFDLGGLADSVAGVRQTGGSIGNGTLTSSTAFDLQAGTVSAALVGTQGLRKSGDGVLSLQGGSVDTGSITLDAGTLALAGNNPRLVAGTLVVQGGLLDLGGSSQALAGVQQNGGEIHNGTLASASAFAMRAGSTSASAVLAGSQGLVKTTDATYTLGGSNTYTGLTAVNAGNLQLAGPQRLAAAGTASVAAGATLSLAGAQALARLDLAGRLAGSGPLTTPDFRSTSGRIDLPLTAARLDITGASEINADATVGTVQVLDGGQLVLGVAGRLIDTQALSVAPTATLRLLGAQTVGTLTLGGTLDGAGSLTAGSYVLQGGRVLAALGAGALTSTGSSLLDAPAAITRLSVLGGTLSGGANTSFSALPAVQVDAGATWAPGSSQRIGSLAGAGNVALDSHSLRSGAGGSSRFDGVIGGAGSLVKEGDSGFTLGGANSFTGGTVVRAGSLALLGANRLADSGAVQVEAGATLSLDASETVATLALAGTLAGSGTLTAAVYQLQGGSTQAGLGTGALVSDGSSRLGGAAAVDSLSVRSGSLQLAAGAPTRAPATTVAAGASLALAGDVTLGSLDGAGSVLLGSATLHTGVAGSSSFGGVLEGSGGLTKQGDGLFTLAGANRYTGATTVAQGTLALAGDGRLADATAVAVAPGAVLSLAGHDTVASLLLQGTLAGSGTLSAGSYLLDGGSSLADLGTGQLTATGSSRLAGRAAAGVVQVQAGQLSLAAPDRLADGSSVSVATGARLTLAGDDHVDSLHLRGTLDGSGTLRTQRTALDGGSLVADLAAGLLSSSGASRLVGQATADAVQVLDGSLGLASANRLLALPLLSVQAGAQLVLGGDASLGSLSGAGGVALGAFTLSAGARADSSYSGVISGSGGLVKRGADTRFSLTGASTYTGSTWVAEGTLALGDGGTSGALATSHYLVDGVLQARRADALRIDQAISGTGALEQLGTHPDSTLSLQGDNKTHTGATRVRSGRLRTIGDEALSDSSDLQVAAGASLVLGGAESVRSIVADGTLDIASRLTSSGSMVLGGAVRAAGEGPLTLQATSIEALNAGNRWGANLSLQTSGALRLSAGSEAGARLPLTLGTLQVGGGGRIEASTLALNGRATLSGATLVLDLDRGEVMVEPSGALLGKLTPANRQIAFTQDVLTQGADSRIEVDDGGGLDVRASRGGSVSLRSETNRFEGNGLSVVVGAPDQPWKANLSTPQAGAIEHSVQNQVLVHGTQVNVGGAGIQSDLVLIKAGSVRTLQDSRIVAKLPYDNLVGSTQSLPALSFELTELAFNSPGSYGQAGAGIHINVGSKLFGERSVLPLDSGFLTVLPLGGARGGTALLLVGPTVGGSYSFFYSGAGQQAEIPVFYNGVSTVTPQVSGSISSTLSVSEGARKERFEEAVRTENVALRLRAGVIAEVGPGTPATVNTMPMDRMRPPACSPAPGTLACAGP